MVGKCSHGVCPIRWKLFLHGDIGGGSGSIWRSAIFNTDQCVQFTSSDLTFVLKKNGMNLSVNGKDRWLDDVFIEQLWLSLKSKCV